MVSLCVLYICYKYTILSINKNMEKYFVSLSLSFGKDSWIVKLNAGNRHIELGLWVTIANTIERRSINARMSHKYWRESAG